MMIEVVFLAIALSMDAFAVSIGLGAKEKSNFRVLAIRAGLLFGFFQMVMPLVGYLGGRGLLGWLESYAHFIAFGLLSMIGVKMFYESFTDVIEEQITGTENRTLFFLAIATSIDALAAGFSLNLLDANPYLACGLIGVVTFGFSAAGVYIGKRTGTLLESRAERFGGVVLFLLGLKILLT